MIPKSFIYKGLRLRSLQYLHHHHKISYMLLPVELSKYVMVRTTIKMSNHIRFHQLTNTILICTGKYWYHIWNTTQVLQRGRGW